MALIGGPLAEFILSRYQWAEDTETRVYSGAHKLTTLFGPEYLKKLRNKRVLDFGCGLGSESIEMARQGAAEVIGIDIREDFLEIARDKQKSSGVANCRFVRTCDSQVDVIVSLDSFEHFSQPDAILAEMARLLQPGGIVMFSFGPPWYHPKGGHLPLFPWAHLLLTEKSLMKWRSKYKSDGATRFHEVTGGLNQMSVRKFERLVEASPLKVDRLEAVPIRAVQPLHCRLTREWFTSVVRGTLVKPA